MTDLMCACPNRHTMDCLFFDPFEDEEGDWIEEEEMTDEEWEVWQEEQWQAHYRRMGDLLKGKKSVPALPATTFGGTFGAWGKDCIHCQDPYSLSDGTVVYLTANREADMRRIQPDHSVWFDKIWRFDEPGGTFLSWRDFGLPGISMTRVIELASECVVIARDGGYVEMGCLGAHGRTGTFLAICELLVMEDPNGEQAVSRVRDLHCSHAVETAEQEWYVDCIAAVLRGEEIPARPFKKTNGKSAKTETKRGDRHKKSKKRNRRKHH